MVAGLREQLGDAAVVELTAFIALANMNARGNVALGHRVRGLRGIVRPQAARRARPTLEGMTTARGDGPHDRRSVRRPSQPALHRRLRAARLGRRRRGHGAGDLAAVGRHRPGRTGRGGRSAGVPGADRQPAGAQPAADAGPPQGGLRRRVAARTAADGPGRRRRRRAGRERVDRDADGARDADADRAGRVRPARGLRPAVRRDRRGDRQVAGGGASDRAPGPLARRGAAAAGGGRPRPSSDERSSGSSPRCRPATCRG